MFIKENIYNARSMTLFQDLYQGLPREMSVHFMDEETSEECSWHIAMETDDALLSLFGTIRQPWEKQFEVQLQVNIVQSQDTTS